MKIINNDDIPTDDIPTCFNSACESVWYVHRETTEGSMQYINKYNSPATGLNPVFNRLDDMWQGILQILNYETLGKRVLELGCGTKKGNVESVYFEYTYQPWLGRFLYATKDKTGIDYVGVDIGDLSSEKFKGIEMNLLEKNCLINNFAENQFDIVISRMLFNSPELERQVSGVVEQRDASYDSSLKLRDNLFSQVEIVLKSEGVFLWQGGDEKLLRIKKTPFWGYFKKSQSPSYFYFLNIFSLPSTF